MNLSPYYADDSVMRESMKLVGFGAGCCPECAEVVCDDDCSLAMLRLLGGQFIPDYVIDARREVAK